MVMAGKLVVGFVAGAVLALTANQFALSAADNVALKDVFKGESQLYRDTVTAEARAGRCAELEGHLATHCNEAKQTLASLDQGNYLDMSLNRYKVFFR
jgi:hypothetical protein